MQLSPPAISGRPGRSQAVIPMLEPILNATLIFIVIREIPGPFALVSAGFVFAGVVLRAILSAKRPKPVSAPHHPSPNLPREGETHGNH